VRIEQRMIDARNVDEQHSAARLQHAPHFGQRRRDVVPVVRAHAADHPVERLIVERQAFSGALLGANVGEAALLRRPFDGGKHRRSNVVRDHLFCVRRHGEACVARAAAHVQHRCARRRGNRVGERAQVGAACMGWTRQIGGGGRAKGVGDLIVMLHG